MPSFIRLIPRHRLLVAVAATVCLASGCGSISATSTVPSLLGASARIQPGVDSGATLDAFRAAIACARQHGMVGLPDPEIDSHGKLILPGLANPPTPTPAVEAACGRLIRRAGALAGSPSGSPPSAADINALERFAHCMRAHGALHWPDPDPNNLGKFMFAAPSDVPPAALPPNDAKRFFAPCQQFMPPSGISIGLSGSSA